MSTEQERQHDRLAIAEEYAEYLNKPPNGMGRDLFGPPATTFENAPLALIQCSLRSQVDLLERLSAFGLLLNPTEGDESRG